MSRFQLIKNYLKYYFRAKTIYQVHSPFLFDLVKNVLEDDRHFYIFEKLENIRIDLLRDGRKIQVTDFGAGSRAAKRSAYGQDKRSVSSIAKNAVSPKSQSQFLFRFIQNLKPKVMLEMGTSLGLNTAYQAAGYVKGELTTLEGCPNIAAEARKTLSKAKISNAAVVVGEFQKTLPNALESLKSVDYVFFDGNHRKKPTLDYFKQCLNYTHNDTVFIFDDIHWSSEMEEAWEVIQQHERVTCTVDLFFFGLVFFRKEQTVKEHLTLIRSKMKPWVMGFFKT